MPLTRPRVPLDEAPIDPASLGRILAVAPQRAILVGGQALAFWMGRYAIGPFGRTRTRGETYVTVDVDWLGSAADAKALATALDGRAIWPRQTALTAPVAQIRLRTDGGAEHNIDVLHQLYNVDGLRPSAQSTARARARALEVHLPSGHRMQVLHPLDVLASRIHNLAGLLDNKGPHVVTQARWGIKVANAALKRVAADGAQSRERPGALAQEIARLALSRAGRVAWDTHGLEVATAIPFRHLAQCVSGFRTQSRAMLAKLHANKRMTAMSVE